jgi:DNA-binding NarL/FixJ family response regulator
MAGRVPSADDVMSLSVLIVDDHRMFAQGLEAVLGAEPDIEPTAISEPEQVVPFAAAHRPDAVLMDLRLGEMTGIGLTGRLAALPGPPAVVILTAYPSTAAAIDAVHAGAVGFLGKSASPEQVLSAVRASVLGGCWFPAALLRTLFAGSPDTAAEPHRRLVAQLTPRERDILELMVSGADRAGIARRLNQSPNTIRTHIRNITVKLGCHGALEAVAVALKAGIRPG